MEDPTAFGGYGGCRTTAEASSAIGDMGAVLATLPARGVSLDTDTKVERFGTAPSGLPTPLFELGRDTSTPLAGFKVPG